MNTEIAENTQKQTDAIKILVEGVKRGQAKGCYKMHEDFMVIFYTDAGDPDFDDSMIQMALDTIPLVNTMTKLYVQEESKIPGYAEKKKKEEEAAAEELKKQEERMASMSLKAEQDVAKF